jgi:hypothetical protein
MTLVLTSIPGFTDLPDSVLVENNPAYSVHVAEISQNAAFGMVRQEVFVAPYVDGDTVILPTSPIDGYNYSREELCYLWTVNSSVNQSTGWVSSPGGSLWYCGWKVDQGLSGPIASSVLDSGGTGYAIGDSFTVNGGVGTPLATGLVDAVSGGIGTGPVTRYHLIENGVSYNVGVGQATTATSGSGTGLTINISAITSDAGKVSSTEAYREDSKTGSATSDGILMVFTIAQRQRTNLIMAESASYAAVDESTIATDKPWTQLLAQSLNENAKFSAVNTEVFYCGEFINGATVPLSSCVSPVDGYEYGYAEIQFVHCWRWTCENTIFRNPPLSVGQLSPFMASISNVGVVSITVEMTPHGSYPVTHTDYGRIAAFAFCRRAATPSSAALAASFSELDPDLFLPGGSLRASTVLEIKHNIDEAVLSPEYFGPTAYADGSTVALPTSPVDGYAYLRSELQYVWDWSDTTPAPGNHTRLAVFSSNIDPVSGAVSLVAFRQIPGGPWADDYNSYPRISVLVIAQRGRTLQPVPTLPKSTPTPPTDAASIQSYQPYDLVFSLPGKPAAGYVYPWITFPRIVGYYVNFAASYGSVGTAATAGAVFKVLLNGTQFGTISVSGSSVSFQSTNGAGASVGAETGSTLMVSGIAAAGGRLTLTAPATQDATLADVSFTLVGTCDTGAQH